MTDEIAFPDARGLTARYMSQELSPVAATEAAFERIAALEPVLNAFQVVDRAGAQAAAAAAEARWRSGQPCGPLTGCR